MNLKMKKLFNIFHFKKMQTQRVKNIFNLFLFFILILWHFIKIKYMRLKYKFIKYFYPEQKYDIKIDHCKHFYQITIKFLKMKNKVVIPFTLKNDNIHLAIDSNFETCFTKETKSFFNYDILKFNPEFINCDRDIHLYYNDGSKEIVHK
jgi:hypothetical protein